MPDFRKLGELAERLPASRADSDWILRWNERGEAVRAVLGETVEPGMVHSFSWKDFILPGACAMTYQQGEGNFLYMTLGLTQPLNATDAIYPWEFAVRTREHAEWPVDLLYQLLSQWLWEKGDMGFGYHLPLMFYIGNDGRIWASISERVQDCRAVGTLRGLYLWTDSARMRFKVSAGDFGILTVVGVTEDEGKLANETTPAHLMLFLRRMGVTQTCDPYRRSVLHTPGASSQWNRIAGMAHDDAFDELQRM
jgi:hypothetical protein